MDFFGPNDTWLSVLNVVGVWFAGFATSYVAYRSISIQTKPKIKFIWGIARRLTASGDSPSKQEFMLTAQVVNTGYQPINMKSAAFTFSTPRKPNLYSRNTLAPGGAILKQHGDSQEIQIPITHLQPNVLNEIKSKKRVNLYITVDTTSGKTYSSHVPKRHWKNVCRMAELS